MEENFELLKKNQTKKGGKRKGAGRKKGNISQKNLEKNLILDRITQRVFRSADRLISAQMNIANGAQYLYVVKTEVDEKGRTTKLRPELVKNENVIASYLAGELDGKKDEYYYITTEKPDNKALDSLLDRTLGKAVNNLDLKSGGKTLTNLCRMSREE